MPVANPGLGLTRLARSSPVSDIARTSARLRVRSRRSVRPRPRRLSLPVIVKMAPMANEIPDRPSCYQQPDVSRAWSARRVHAGIDRMSRRPATDTGRPSTHCQGERRYGMFNSRMLQSSRNTLRYRQSGRRHSHGNPSRTRNRPRFLIPDARRSGMADANLCDADIGNRGYHRRRLKYVRSVAAQLPLARGTGELALPEQIRKGAQDNRRARAFGGGSQLPALCSGQSTSTISASSARLTGATPHRFRATSVCRRDLTAPCGIFERV